MARMAAPTHARPVCDDGVRSRLVLHPDLGPARLAVLVALETYAGALAATGWPLPYRLRDELFLYRRITGPARPASAE